MFYNSQVGIIRRVCSKERTISSLCGLPSSNISNYLKTGMELKIPIIEKLISPFGIKVGNITLDLVASELTIKSIT